MSMKRGNSRAPSPTPTSFSGISNYRNTDSYRAGRDKNAPGVPPIDYRQISKTHFEELSKYLAAYLTRTQPNSRSSARQKLTRLTIQQFHELSTDVYDELMRRKTEQQVPFLPVREDFHPKRNQARQKLATLPTSRFEDLSSDVYFELARRYPEFKEDPSGRDSNYDDYPAPDFPTNSNGPSRTGPPSRTSTDRPSDSGYSSGRRSEDRRRPSEDYRRGDDNPYSSRGMDGSYSRRKPSQDISRKSEDREREPFGRRPSASASNASDGTATAPPQSTTATSAMIIPIKSTMEEEYIEVPYGRETRESSGTLDTPGPEARDALLAEDSASDYPMSPRSPPGGLSGLSARLKMDDEEDDGPAAGNKSGDDYFDKYGRSSVNSDRSASGRGFGGRASVGGDADKIRRDYEYKIATMQTQITNLQREVDDAKNRELQWADAQSRVDQLENELDSVRRKSEEQSATILNLQQELEDLRETRQREKEREARRIQDDEEELQILRDRCERLESERGQGISEGDKDLVEQLRNDMEGLLVELDNLNRRNDELMTAKDSDLAVIRDLDAQLKEYKRKYEQAKTELRSVKATSQLFLPTPKFEKSEDQLPVAPDGGVLDIHITAFMTAIDALLTAGRSNAPTRVLTPMKTVVNAVTNIVEDVRSFERKPNRDPEVDVDALRALRDRAEATLSNLVAATKTHATSHGMSPVSLLDAAASHVSTTITEIARTVCIRKASKQEQEQFSYSSPPPTATNGYAPNLRSVDESQFTPSHQRKASQASSISSTRNRFLESPPSPPTRS
ncbi:hypothetical protein CC2G_009047 [Coprinopsis cinerea AmutBmut pab1-1]|nr:hypothetical protein CC2G_009047 [Coprinopsis cinerea AmutBmut pab1-1]